MKLRCTIKIKKLICILLVLLVVIQIAVSAEGPYNNYNYDPYKKPIPTVAGYLPDDLITGISLEVGDFDNPQDMYYDNNQYLYILDSGNNRIVVLNKELQFEREISPKDRDGNKITFEEATGIFVHSDGRILIADKAAKKVFIMDSNGVIQKTIGEPKSDIIKDNFDYKPCKVLMNSSNIVYVISEGCYEGALEFNEDGEFLSFFGSETVIISSAKDAVNLFWKKILPKNMSKKLLRNVPADFNNFDIDSQGFIYTTTDDSETTALQVRKLNYLGDNILCNIFKAKKYGDHNSYQKLDEQNQTSPTAFVDVDIDKRGFINVLDLTRKRVFQYDQDSNLLFTFGGRGNQFGCFAQPTAIETINGKIFVLDSTNKSITIMRPTFFAENVQNAVKLYSDGKYSDAQGMWEEALRYDSNYTLANIGIGKAYEEQGKYKESFQHFIIANDKEDYSNSFYHYRYKIMHDWFPFILITVLLLIFVPMIVSDIRRKRKKNDYEITVSKYRYPFYTIRHPFKGFVGLKEDKKGSVLVSNIIVLLFFLVKILVEQNTGFLFRVKRLEDFNILYTAVSTIGFFLIWVLCNWALSTLMDGEGKFMEIWVFSAYALLPYVITMIPITIISNGLVLDEKAFYEVAVKCVYIWVGICLIMAIKEVHQFTLKKTVLAILGTVLGIVIVLALYCIIFSMFMQLIGFVGIIINEIALRL